MRLAISILFALACLTACSSQPKSSGEPGELVQAQSIMDSTRKAFLAADFGKLESMSTEYREQKSRLPSGRWKLTMFYAGIDAATFQAGDNRESLFATLESSAKRWTELYPRSPAAHIAYAKMMIHHGWAYRGTGYADSVRQEDWEPFFRYVALGRDYLDRKKSVAASDPQWYGTMLEVARIESWKRDRYDALLNEALEREPLYYQNYFEALQYLLPKWGGNPREVEKFAEEAVRRTSAQEGTGMYARVYWTASQSQWGDRVLADSLAQWRLMREAFDDVIDKYPDAWNLNNYAKFACLARDKAITREILERVQAVSVMPEAWEPEGLFKRCTDWANTPDPKMARWDVSPPVPVRPKPGTVFDNFPRGTEIEWQAVPGAAYYSVEVDCLNCCRPGKWCSEIRRTPIAVSIVSGTTFRFQWFGPNDGRWRVWAVSKDRKETDKTPWQEFSYKR